MYSMPYEQQVYGEWRWASIRLSPLNFSKDRLFIPRGDGRLALALDHAVKRGDNAFSLIPAQTLDGPGELKQPPFNSDELAM